MEWLINTIKECWNWFTSLEGVGTVTLGSIVTFVVQLLLKNKSILKANAKYNALSNEYKQYQELSKSEKEYFKSQLAQYTVLFDNVYDLVAKLSENSLNQNEAMITAFNNSNLNASAKKLVEELLKPIKTLPTADEILKDDQLPISNAVTKATPTEEKQEVKVDEQQPKVFRVK